MFELMDNHSEEAVIKVVGVGGGGGNAVEYMVASNIEGVEFVAANTDAQALRNSSANLTLQLGANVTKGLGAGANPDIGRRSAEEDRETIKKTLLGADMVFIAAGMGGGTGTGAAPIVAQVAKELGILTVAVVTKPFPFEGKKRANFADEGINELSKYVDSLITIPNDKLLKVLGKGTSLLDAFKAANNVLLGAVQGIAELITRPDLINVDFADVRTVMSEMGTAMMGTGRASGPDRAEEAADQAISSPLLEDIDLSGAKGILVNITAGLDLTIDEFEIVGNAVKAFASENATVVVGAVIDPEMSDELRVTVVATGIGVDRKPDISLGHGHAVHGGMRHHDSYRNQEPFRGADLRSVEGNRGSYASNHSANVYGQAGNHYGNAARDAMPAAMAAEPATKPVAENKANIDIFDIPAFLRKQAD